MNYTTTFYPDKRAEAEESMLGRMEPWLALLDRTMIGQHRFMGIEYAVTDFSAKVTFPWNRAFEIRADIVTVMK